MNITIEALDKVIEETGAAYADAKKALVESGGDIDAAIAALKAQTAETAEGKRSLDELKEKLKSIVAEGNARRVVVRRKGEEVISVPLNVGVIGGIVGVASAPVAVILGAVAAYGLDCTIEVERKDGTTETLK